MQGKARGVSEMTVVGRPPDQEMEMTGTVGAKEITETREMVTSGGAALADEPGLLGVAQRTQAMTEEAVAEAARGETLEAAMVVMIGGQTAEGVTETAPRTSWRGWSKPRETSLGM